MSNRIWLSKEQSKLGLGFIKFSQWFSVYFKYRLQSYRCLHLFIDSMRLLQDQCSPHAPDWTHHCIQPFIERGVILSYDIDPIASGSIAQVHTGILNNKNTKIAIKIKHPDLDKEIRAIKSKWILKYVLGCDWNSFCAYIETQLDFYNELKNMKFFYQILETSQFYMIPEPIECNENVLIMGFVPSIPFQYVNCSEECKLKLIILFMYMLFIHNCFHRDLHNGNWGIHESHAIVLYDFGWVSFNVNQFKEMMELSLKDRNLFYQKFLHHYGIRDNFMSDAPFYQWIETFLTNSSNVHFDELLSFFISLSVFVESMRSLDNHTIQYDDFKEQGRSIYLYLYENDLFPELADFIQEILL